MKITDKITQYFMERKLRESYGDNVLIQRGPNGSLFIPSNAPEVPEWRVDGKSDFDKFIKRYGMTAVDAQGNEVGKYTMASRGSIEASKDVTMIAPEYKDRFGRRWTVIQEEARPIDVARRGKNARVLAFPAGIIGDEAAFKNESAMESAVRELTEETGLKPKKIVCLNPHGEIRTTPGLTDEATNFYKATIEELKPSAKALTDGGVTRGWHFVPVKRLPQWFEALAKTGKTASGQTLTAIALMILSKGKIKA
jgi:8-oxo-dGTP pyrophosphatase MutT (NUDIX family)